MTTVDLVRGDPEALVDDLAHPVGREEAVVTTQKESRGNRGPLIERPRLVPRRVGLTSTPLQCLRGQLGRDVMVEGRDIPRVLFANAVALLDVI
jgi:hypothetical protein